MPHPNDFNNGRLSVLRFLPYCVAALCGVSQSITVGATELLYVPVNPSFGGNPGNAAGLMGIAQAQNGFKATVAPPMDNFNLSLQRAILSRLTTQSLSTMFGSNSSLTAGSYDTLGYTIDVTDDKHGTLTITTRDKLTGDFASFVINAATLP
jgi:curli production assembly/transport component CsgF